MGVVGVALCIAAPTPPPCVSPRSSTKGKRVSTSGRAATSWRFLEPAAAATGRGAVRRTAFVLRFKEGGRTDDGVAGGSG